MQANRSERKKQRKCLECSKPIDNERSDKWPYRYKTLCVSCEIAEEQWWQNVCELHDRTRSGRIKLIRSSEMMPVPEYPFEDGRNTGMPKTHGDFIYFRIRPILKLFVRTRESKNDKSDEKPELTIQEWRNEWKRIEEEYGQ